VEPASVVVTGVDVVDIDSATDVVATVGVEPDVVVIVVVAAAVKNCVSEVALKTRSSRGHQSSRTKFVEISGLRI
jgi:hypothetical protein